MCPSAGEVGPLPVYRMLLADIEGYTRIVAGRVLGA